MSDQKKSTRAVAPYLTIVGGISTMASVMMQDLIGEYGVPEPVAEWKWVEAHASYQHVGNGTSQGVWEFVLNLANELTDVPAALVPTIEWARNSGIHYLLFHQG